LSIDVVNPREARALAAGKAAPSARRELVDNLVRRKAFIAGVVILLFWVFCAIFPGALPSHSPYTTDLLNINQSPSSSHWFGTDQLGRDMFARVIAGARDVLIIAPLATLLGTIIGTAIGLVMGYFRGAVDDVVSRFVEAFLALPLVITGILGVVALGSSIPTMVIIIGIVFAPLIARTVRAAVLLERDLDYVQAAKLRGESSLYIMFIEILPNVMAPIVVEFTVRLGYAVFTLVSLSFLGFGLGPPSPNWGSDIGQNYGLVIAGYWWEVLFDALAIATLVIAVNLISTSIEATLEDT
jgi:peptide/nickel transport system permease protein